MVPTAIAVVTGGYNRTTVQGFCRAPALRRGRMPHGADKSGEIVRCLRFIYRLSMLLTELIDHFSDFFRSELLANDCIEFR